MNQNTQTPTLSVNTSNLVDKSTISTNIPTVIPSNTVITHDPYKNSVTVQAPQNVDVKVDQSQLTSDTSNTKVILPDTKEIKKDEQVVIKAEDHTQVSGTNLLEQANSVTENTTKSTDLLEKSSETVPPPNHDLEKEAQGQNFIELAKS